VFESTPLGQRLRRELSWLIIPMMNPDGVICGYYRPNGNGDDMNRAWQSPTNLSSPIASSVLDLLDLLSKSRQILFFLDFHGHCAACNSFVYGFNNDENPDICGAERTFALLMAKNCLSFSLRSCSYLKQKQYEGTMRVVIRRRFHVLFAYTLEMSFGGCNFGPDEGRQYTPDYFESVGVSVAHSIDELLVGGAVALGKEVMLLFRGPEGIERALTRVPARCASGIRTAPGYMRFACAAQDVSIMEPHSVTCALNQAVVPNDWMPMARTSGQNR
jgi:hypothetical protein